MKYIGSFHAQERSTWTDLRFFQFLFFSDRVFLLRSGDKINMADSNMPLLKMPGAPSKPMLPGPLAGGPRGLADYTYATDSYQEIRAAGEKLINQKGFQFGKKTNFREIPFDRIITCRLKKGIYAPFVLKMKLQDHKTLLSFRIHMPDASFAKGVLESALKDKLLLSGVK